MEPSDIHRIQIGDSEVVLIGTAHISQESIDTVRQVITDEQPDCVCVELDEQRLTALNDKNHWEKLNIYQVIRKGQAAFLMANLALSSYQKRMGLQTGVRPGSELIDRNIRTTLLRAWRKTGLWKKINLISVLFASMFDKTVLDEVELAKLRQSDTLSAMLEELGDLLPTVKGILVDERDQYMAHHIRKANGKKIVAIVGAAHLPGILKRLQGDEVIEGDESIEEINSIPPKSRVSKAIPWSIPAVVVLLFILGFFFGDTDRLADAALAWILANGILSAIGAMLAFGHPLTILTAFIAAPITSLNPTIGAGMVTGVVQAMVAAPTVRDLENVSEDMTTFRGWWTNRTTRVLLVFFLSSLGSAIGTFVAFGWLKNLF